jgi:hypothetical protein
MHEYVESSKIDYLVRSLASIICYFLGLRECALFNDMSYEPCMMECVWSSNCIYAIDIMNQFEIGFYVI